MLMFEAFINGPKIQHSLLNFLLLNHLSCGTLVRKPNLELSNSFSFIQSVFEMRAQILTTSYWLHVELGKNM
jgi:hypothetical protein